MKGVRIRVYLHLARLLITWLIDKGSVETWNMPRNGISKTSPRSEASRSERNRIAHLTVFA